MTARYSGKVAVDVLRDSRKFLGHPYIGRVASSQRLATQDRYGRY